MSIACKSGKGDETPVCLVILLFALTFLALLLLLAATTAVYFWLFYSSKASKVSTYVSKGKDSNTFGVPDSS